MSKNTKRDRKRAYEVIDFYKEDGCVLCGYNKCNGALEFHHIGTDKEYAISDFLSNGRSRDTIRKEIEKCILVCANCHREIHAGCVDGISNVKTIKTKNSLQRDLNFF